MKTRLTDRHMSLVKKGHHFDLLPMLPYFIPIYGLPPPKICEQIHSIFDSNLIKMSIWPSFAHPLSGYNQSSPAQ